jgi:hypothetical protein
MAMRCAPVASTGANGPLLLERAIADIALQPTDRQRGVETCGIAGGFAGVVADASCERRKRVVG